MKLSQTEFGRLGGVGKTTQINYEQGGTSPTAAYLQALMAHGVDSVYILTGRRTAGEPESLSPDEAELLGNYRACDPENRTAAGVVLRSLARNSDLTRQMKGGDPASPADHLGAPEQDAAYRATQPEPPRIHRMTMWRDEPTKDKRGKR